MVRALKVNARCRVHSFKGCNGWILVKVIKEHDLYDIYEVSETDLQPSKILTFCGDPFHVGTQPNSVLQFSLQLMLTVVMNWQHL
jgi:hypothetical protein